MQRLQRRKHLESTEQLETARNQKKDLVEKLEEYARNMDRINSLGEQLHDKQQHVAALVRKSISDGSTVRIEHRRPV